MLRKKDKKLGVTLVELVVAMGIFAIVTTLAVGAFITVSRMMTLTDSMKNTQQKLRVAIEMINRLARQASVVLVTNSTSTEGSVTSTVEMYFAPDSSGTPQSASRFEIKADGPGSVTRSLYYSECRGGSISLVTKKCDAGNGWQVSNDLLSGPLRLDPPSGFSKSGTIPSILTAKLYGSVPGAPSNNSYYSDTMDITSDTLLEQVR